MDDEESNAATEEFVDQELKSPDGMSNLSNDHQLLAENIESDDENVERRTIDPREPFDSQEVPSTTTPTILSDCEKVRKPIKIEYMDDANNSADAIIRSPSPEVNSTELELESDVGRISIKHQSKIHSPSRSDANPESPVSTVDAFETQKISDSHAQSATSPAPHSPVVGPESTINSSSVGFESLSPQSMIDDDEYPHSNVADSSCRNVDESGGKGQETSKKPLPKQSLEDQEGELDFEEETSEEKRDGATELVPRHRKITMGNVEKKSSIKVVPKMENSEDKEEGEEVDDADDDGELIDDDDLEEGEVKESSALRKVIQPKPICRFYSKGQCTWGSACRFLHPGINDKGNYNMFAPTKSLVPNNMPPVSSPYVWSSRQPDVSSTFGSRGYIEPLPLPMPLPPPPLPPPPPPPHFEEPPRESAWERGLRHAKEILRKSTKLKVTEPDFEEKSMNLGLSSADTGDYEKENDYYTRSSPYRHSTTATEPYSSTYGYDESPADPYERQAHDYWRGGNYENFEVRYTRTDHPYKIDRTRLKERETDHRDPRNRERDLYREPQTHDRERADHNRRDKFGRAVQHTPERPYRDERYAEHQPAPSRSGRSGRGERGDEWCDPWRRSTSPKRRNLSRSFSSHSSVSYSSSGHSSGSKSSSYSSRSRSSSGSSNSSFSRSRSYSPNHAVQQQQQQQHHHHHHHHHHPQHYQHHQPVQHDKVPARERITKYPPVSIRSGTPVEIQRRPKPLPPGGHIPPPHPSSGVRPPPDKRPTSQSQAMTSSSQAHASGDRKRIQKPTPPAPPKVPTRHRSLSSSGSDSFSSRSKSRIASNSAAWALGKRQRKSRSRSSHTGSSSGSSLVSVSSKSSASSKSSFNSGRNMSTLDALKREERRVREREKMRTADVQRRPLAAPPASASDRERASNARESRVSRGVESQDDQRVRSLVNTPRTSKDPLRQAGQKPQIKLTLLNKAPLSEKVGVALPPARKQVTEVRKQKPTTLGATEKEPSKPIKVATPSAPSNSRKRPLPASPLRGASDTSTAAKMSSSSSSSRGATAGPKAQSVSAAAAALLNKKSTSSRREELLKQLKAVEDAIARKRAKFT